MEITKNAVAGTVESSDIMITVDANNTNEISISLDSSVEKQFGEQIRKVITDTLKNLGVTAAKVTAVDKGALDCTIQARTITAVHRAMGKDSYNWKEIDSWNV
ncbi:citrate lyase subunit gamma (acyl carrier protein) [Enterococcus sp. PF1-24]|uniref:citrate lyase acyl carrier protein n=1 Tax=unclassified Enterococcus TaxID=2608891 RepID=UPI00247508E7|nr:MULTISPECIES: citrate lyase acyl carrier protein [unclassified Enterococcus]MDH6365824.1 citrate lyase subunit gamma (acyl carrier protein) [Enterococcus sp. PFB1-1]MDH6400760.1 citrate lyase subunit gamma (acyl carrier protein) [Enterococcus sp. PF1-24]